MKIDFARDFPKDMDTISKSDLIKSWIAACPEDDPIFLSDCILRGGMDAAPVLEELAFAEEQSFRSLKKPMTWKLLVLRDEWGNVPQPGDKIKKRNPKNIKRANGSLTSPMERDVAMNDGSYEERFIDTKEYEVDKKGCIEVSFTDAGYFLMHYGVHPANNRAITTKHKEHSTEPCETGKYDDNGRPILKHVWYWRYKEMDRDGYAALPRRKDKSDLSS